MYDTISQVFLALFIIAYLALLAALVWWAAGGGLGSATKKNVVTASVRAAKDGPFLGYALRGKELKSGTAADSSYGAPSSGRNWKG